ncbi:hypothetical protein, partial [Burkholderia ubonensis]|uniref:hypothetical protein n=1 Tax=Burkholderia ubonensis TaxID=101571 RepID=UPI001E4E93B1
SDRYSFWEFEAHPAPGNPLQGLVQLRFACPTTITGYHGAGVYWNGKEFPKSALRNANSPSSVNYNPEDMVRRSTVSAKFDHGTSVDP